MGCAVNEQKSTHCMNQLFYFNSGTLDVYCTKNVAKKFMALAHLFRRYRIECHTRFRRVFRTPFFRRNV